MKVKYKATNKGPSQFQIVELDLPASMTIVGIEALKDVITQQLDPNNWTTVDPEGLEIKPLIEQSYD
jgi:hypothetical protein|tara:strand:+ start:275 stop:475 length:201 start_codon:yes stop_codon:yes gene_type:complete